jgi:superoxide reductase
VLAGSGRKVSKYYKAGKKILHNYIVDFLPVESLNVYCSLAGGGFMAKRFFICKLCGNIVGVVKEGGGKLSCCGQAMTELTANTTDAAQEKHVPVITVAGDSVKVSVGSVTHPMTPEHFIEWIHLETKQGAQMAHLTPDDAPEFVFSLADGDEAVAAYAYCNLHGLWKAEV